MVYQVNNYLNIDDLTDSRIANCDFFFFYMRLKIIFIVLYK